MFRRLLAYQRNLMEVLGIRTVVEQPFYEQPEFVDAVIGIAKEALETHDAIGATGKPWKETGEAKVKEELVDVLFFWLEAAILAGLNADDIERLYVKKFQVNLSRILRISSDSNIKTLALVHLKTVSTTSRCSGAAANTGPDHPQDTVADPDESQ